MLAGMDGEEFEEWKIIDQYFDPFGNDRADLRSGEAVAHLANIMKVGFRFIGPLATMPKDFCHTPKDWKPKRKPPVTKKSKEDQIEEMKMVCRALAEAHKLKEERKSKRTKGSNE